MGAIIYWKDINGFSHGFEKVDKNAELKDTNCIYILAKQIEEGTFKAIYLGNGNIKELTSNNVLYKCAESKGFTHFFVIIFKKTRNRKMDLNDLILGNPDCLEENGGCNKTPPNK